MTTTTQTATKITNLDDLLTALRDGSVELTPDLPTFGGDEPDDTNEIWSWDADRLLVGSCAAELEIVTRTEWYGEDEPDITDEQIDDLRTEAGAHGDMKQVQICEGALKGDEDDRAECARVIAEARAARAE